MKKIILDLKINFKNNFKKQNYENYFDQNKNLISFLKKNFQKSIYEKKFDFIVCGCHHSSIFNKGFKN
jgi:hypothetical protein